MKPNKLIVITNLFPLPWQPLRAAFNRQQFKRLAQKRDVSVLVPVAWPQWFKNGRIFPLMNVTTNEFSSFRYACYFYTPGVCRIFYGIFLFFSLLIHWRWFRREKGTCLIACWAYPDGVSSALLAKLLKIPFLIKVHGSDINVFAQDKLRAKQMKWAMEKSEGVISVSQALKDKIVSMGVREDKIHVIYNGVDPCLFKVRDKSECCKILDLPEESKIFLFVGNLIETKGINELLVAFQKKTINEHTSLYFAGNGPYQKKIEEFAKDNELTQRIRCLGGVAHEKLGLWFSAADLVVLPSYSEGVPNVLLESMASGTPIVATRVGGIPEVVPSYAGILVSPRDAHSLQKALELAENKSWDREKIASHGKSFSWEKNIEQLDKIILKTELKS